MSPLDKVEYTRLEGYAEICEGYSFLAFLRQTAANLFEQH